MSKFEKARIRFSSDVSAAVAVIDARAPYYPIQGSKKPFNSSLSFGEATLTFRLPGATLSLF